MPSHIWLLCFGSVPHHHHMSIFNVAFKLPWIALIIESSVLFQGFSLNSSGFFLNRWKCTFYLLNPGESNPHRTLLLNIFRSMVIFLRYLSQCVWILRSKCPLVLSFLPTSSVVAESYGRICSIHGVPATMLARSALWAWPSAFFWVFSKPSLEQNFWPSQSNHSQFRQRIF